MGREEASTPLTDPVDPVTEADKAAERLIRDEIAKTFPEHGVYGEEFGLQEGNGLTWVPVRNIRRS